jgi:Legionella pneumophila major outer membrane protein precursor
MKRLSQWVLCVVAFGSPFALAAYPNGDVGTQLPPATATVGALGEATGTGINQLPAAVPAVAADTPAAPTKPAPAPAATAKPAAAPAVQAPCASPAPAGCAPKPCCPPAPTCCTAAPTCCTPKCCPLAQTCCQPTPACCQPKVPCLCDTCGDCDHHGGIIGGLGLYLIQPYFSNNPSYAVIAAPAGFTAATSAAISHIDVNHNMDIAPEFWLGYIGDDGLGVRLRWWSFRQDTSQSLAAPASTVAGGSVVVASAAPLGIPLFVGNDGTALAFNDTTKLELQVWDLEALQDLRVGRFDLLFSAGLRFAHINQEYNAFATGTNEFGITTSGSEALVSANSFDGLGPVVGLEARRPIGDTGLALYGNLRGALLFGSAKQSAFANNAASGFVGDEEAALTATDHHDRVMPVGELEIGVEYARDIGNMRVFGQLALVGQDWVGAGNASHSNSVSLEGIPVLGATADSDIGFFGLAFRIGVNY